MDEIDLVVMHQANQRIVDAAVSGLGIDRDRVLVESRPLGQHDGGQHSDCVGRSVWPRAGCSAEPTCCWWALVPV